MPVSIANSSSFPRFNTHFSNSMKQSNLTSKTQTFPQIKTFCVKKTELSASDDIPVVSTVSGPIHGSQPIEAGSSMRKPISLWPGMYHSPVTNALWEARSRMFEKRCDGAQDSHTELIAKAPSKSRTSIAYKFSSDYILREQYRNPWDEMRMGKLLEDLDALAGAISYKHCRNHDGATRSILLVTASVDKMVLKNPIRVDFDLKISGAVNGLPMGYGKSQHLPLNQIATNELHLTMNVFEGWRIKHK